VAHPETVSPACFTSNLANIVDHDLRASKGVVELIELVDFLEYIVKLKR